MDYVLTQQTADRLRLLMGQQPGEESGGRAPRRGARTVLVRCTDATAVSDTAPGNVCYPGVVLLPANDDDVGGPEEIGEVWLTVWGTDGDVVPTVDQVYPCVLSGELELEIDPDTEETETRVRAHAGEPGGLVAHIRSGGTLLSTTAWEDVYGADFTVEAGFYFVSLRARARATCSALGTEPYILVRLYNVTTASEVFEMTVLSAQVTGVAIAQSACWAQAMSLAAGTYRIEAKRGSAGGTAWSSASLAGDNQGSVALTLVSPVTRETGV